MASNNNSKQTKPYVTFKGVGIPFTSGKRKGTFTSAYTSKKSVTKGKPPKKFN